MAPGYSIHGCLRLGLLPNSRTLHKRAIHDKHDKILQKTFIGSGHCSSALTVGGHWCAPNHSKS